MALREDAREAQLNTDDKGHRPRRAFWVQRGQRASARPRRAPGAGLFLTRPGTQGAALQEDTVPPTPYCPVTHVAGPPRPQTLHPQRRFPGGPVCRGLRERQSGDCALARQPPRQSPPRAPASVGPAALRTQLSSGRPRAWALARRPAPRQPQNCWLKGGPVCTVGPGRGCPPETGTSRAFRLHTEGSFVTSSLETGLPASNPLQWHKGMCLGP